MKELHDDDIQKLLEQSSSATNTELSASQKEDFEIYRHLFQALKKGPEAGLPYNFSAKVAKSVQVKTSRTNDFKFYVLVLLILIPLIMGAYLLLFFINHQVAFQLVNTMLTYKWVLLFALISLFTIQFLDQKLIKEPNFPQQ